MKAPDPEGIPRIGVSTKELEALLEQAKQEPLREEGYHKLKAAIRTLGYVTELLEKKETTLASVRELLCPASTEKTDKVLKQAGIDTGEKKSESLSKKPKGTATGHGRNSAAAYSGAQKVKVPHASLKPGDACPDGCGGKVYPQREPGVLVRIKGQAPLAATVYELEKVRCNLCGNVYTAEAPADAGCRHDRPVALRQRGPMESDGRPRSEPRNPAPSGDTMRDHGADRAPAPTSPGGTQAPGRAS
jgi:hypothetical protein